MPPNIKNVDYEELTEKFKKLLITDFKTNLSASELEEKCL
jgi:ribosomal protein S17E